MTIDEAIKHEQNRDYPVSAKYHNQLAEWLEELKDLRKWKDEKCDKCDYFISVEEAYKQGRADEYNRIIGFLKYTRYAIVDNNGDYYSIEELEDMLKENK